jgi:hypothetical protein
MKNIIVALLVVIGGAVQAQEVNGLGKMFGDVIQHGGKAAGQTLITRKVKSDGQAALFNGLIEGGSSTIDNVRENGRAKQAAQEAEINRLRAAQSQQVVMVPQQTVVTHAPAVVAPAPVVVQAPAPAPAPVVTRAKFIKAGNDTFQEGRDATGNTTLTPVNVELIQVGPKWYQKTPNGVLVHVDVEAAK